MRIDTMAQDAWAVLKIQGDLDVYTAARLSAKIHDAVEKDETRGLAIDLSEVNFMDSTGLSIIVTSHKRANANNLDFKLIRPSNQIRRILQLTDLISVIPIDEELPESVKVHN